MFNKSLFAERLKTLRAEQSLSVYDLSENTGIPAEMLIQYEHEEEFPHIEILCVLSEYFHVSIDFLIGKTDFPAIISNNMVDLLMPTEINLIQKRRKLVPFHE